ncbi:hypothetical protein BJ912DRAFT_1073256 [Pholiota molesta]|nr:hypothetical protein BJ912DRAFT_1073256 [Pholiota molesta]
MARRKPPGYAVVRRSAQHVSGERRESLETPLSPSSDINSIGEAPSPPPKSFRNSLTTNLKRFSSLPRTPSLSSKSARRSSESTRHSSRTPSPSIHMFSRPAFKKIKATNPAALFCHEVHSQTTTLQRCAIYAAKINELYIHDCGLSEWVDDTKSRDASVATDLSQGAYRDITPPGVPALPYPSLAMNPPPHAQPTRSNSSAGSGTPTSSIRSLAATPSLSLKGGFFASLGRKASISGPRKDKYLPTISAPIPVSTGLAGRAGSKHSHASVNFPRAVNAANLPSVPGGPRAPPNRAQRSQTFMTSPIAKSPLDRAGNQELTRRPSLFNLTLDTVIDIHVDPDLRNKSINFMRCCLMLSATSLLDI